MTGGAGYIGSHTCKALSRAGYKVVVFDNLVAGHRAAVRYGDLVEGDIADLQAVRSALKRHEVSGVVHLAAYLDVGESVREPARYYRNNVMGALTVLEAMALESVRAILSAMGKPDRIVHVGESGAGQICKACNQIVLGGTMAVVAEAIALSRKAGVDPMKVRAALMGGFAQSRVLEVHGERMITGNWKPGFKAKLFKKDLGIAMNTLAENGVPAPTSAVVQQLVNAQIAAGEGEEDYSGIAKAIFRLANL